MLDTANYPQSTGPGLDRLRECYQEGYAEAVAPLQRSDSWLPWVPAPMAGKRRERAAYALGWLHGSGTSVARRVSNADRQPPP